MTVTTILANLPGGGYLSVAITATCGAGHANLPTMAARTEVAPWTDIEPNTASFLAFRTLAVGPAALIQGF